MYQQAVTSVTGAHKPESRLPGRHVQVEVRDGGSIRRAGWANPEFPKERNISYFWSQAALPGNPSASKLTEKIDSRQLAATFVGNAAGAN
jgi:hypothetical protein